MKNIVLTGFMASGKTEVGKAAAKLCDYTLIDTDDMVIETENKDINTIFAENGESYFRNAETAAVKRAAKTEKAIISTGGGVVLRRENIEFLRSTGIVYYLAPDFDTIASRIEKAAQTRPLMKGQSIDEIKRRFEDRIPFYENCDVKIVISPTDTPEDIAKKILTEHGIIERK